ncbi:hypothetical protein [Sphingobium boeckii]|uniref:Uncharacterized protein n=1 Tax=Sphingobium boeckii TaxID=1082345 RepID=A0A7W9AKD3_9SPHN|nr:hypothetical protein [Sphingobium boeckii]MBB5687039.1 hypothetical protein [Sphingobium boeckii]
MSFTKTVRQKMQFSRAAITLAMSFMAASPAAAQFFIKPPDYRGAPVTGTETGLFVPLPGARPEELRAAMVWSLRTGLNLAALQCQFQESLLTVNQYVVLLKDHKAELNSSYETLKNYFKRTSKSPGAGLVALDKYGTKVSISYSTVGGQYGFCRTASHIGRAALFTPKGGLGTLAAARLAELRKSLSPAWDQHIRRFYVAEYQGSVPAVDTRCYDKKGREKKCKKS